jgi:4-alpha-glucanotransferase
VYYGAHVTSLQSRRSSGILLHPTSLPGPFAVGDFGKGARTFVDFLAAAGQTLWQVLPLGPIGLGNSPYQSCSAFAGNTLLIDPCQLEIDGLLEASDLAGQNSPEEYVDYQMAARFKERLLDQAFETFKQQPAHHLRVHFESFGNQASWWLNDYALYRALKNVNGDGDWSTWDQDIAFREPQALAVAAKELHEQIEAQKFFQFLFFRQWQSLREYAIERRVKIIGDLPIFVAYDSADVWTHREYFQLDEIGSPTAVAGVPPDYFSETGQLWGNPLYDWPRMREDGFRWWIDRMRWLLTLYDFIRVDHFRGFTACWEIPAGAPTAVIGRWAETPGRELFTALQKTLGDLPIIAENLGIITKDVESLREEFGFPGMRVLQFAFGDDDNNEHLPQNYTRDTVVYTGTHDNDTSCGWFANLSEEERDRCLSRLGSDGREINWDMIHAALSSVADTAIIPAQDLLGLGSEARMNVPASETGNWKWRLKPDALSEKLASRLQNLAELSGRT